MTQTLSPEKAALLRRTVTRHLSDDEHALFLETCERSGLDPFARHIYVAKRTRWANGRPETETRTEATIDGFRLTAERSGKYAGQLGPEWCGTDGVWKDIWTEQQPPTAARVGILRSDFREPVWGKALYAEFVQLQNGQPTEFWVRMASNQVAKCAEALGFRKAFPRELSGLYTPDEMAQSDSGSTVALISSVEPPRQTGLSGVSDPDHGGGPRPSRFPASVPLPLQPFVEAGFGNRRNIAAAFEFLQGELVAAYGEDVGRELFREIHMKLPRTFKTREACAQGTLACWLGLWAALHPEVEQEEAA